MRRANRLIDCEVKQISSNTFNTRSDKYQKDRDSFQSVSIHAPNVGSDKPSNCSKQLRNFNPCSQCRERRVYLLGVSRRVVSIHAPVCRCARHSNLLEIYYRLRIALVRRFQWTHNIYWINFMQGVFIVLIILSWISVADGLVKPMFETLLTKADWYITTNSRES